MGVYRPQGQAEGKEDRKRQENPKLLTVDEVSDQLEKINEPPDEETKSASDSEDKTTPQQRARKLLDELPTGAVVACVRQLVEAGRFKKASRLAKEYLKAAETIESYPLRVHSRHLIYLVEQLREKAAKTGKANLAAAPMSTSQPAP